METKAENTGSSKTVIWIGRVISALPVFMMLMSASMKLKNVDTAEPMFTGLGYQRYHVVPIGVTEVVCVVLYVIPQTSVLGAILITGYLGGATATHVRVGDPKFLMPVLLGVLAWLGLLLRERRLWVLLPLRR